MDILSRFNCENMFKLPWIMLRWNVSHRESRSVKVTQMNSSAVNSESLQHKIDSNLFSKRSRLLLIMLHQSMFCGLRINRILRRFYAAPDVLKIVEAWNVLRKFICLDANYFLCAALCDIQISVKLTAAFFFHVFCASTCDWTDKRRF